MKRRKLKKLRVELERLRRSPQKASALEGLAGKLGRKRVNRGKEPMWESEEFKNLPPLSIPHHGAKDVAPGTKKSILNQLEDDIIAWDETLPEEDDDGEDDDEE
jgi:hypothetical protein